MSIRDIFVGRDKEISAMNRALSFALKGQTQVIFVSGEAGIGKTALIGEFAQQAQKKNTELLVAAGSCDSQSGAGDPYLPFREILAMLAGDTAGPLRRKITNPENATRLQKFLSYSGLALVELGPDLLEALIPGYGLLIKTVAFASKQTGLTEKMEKTVKGRGAVVKDIEPGRIAEQYQKVLRKLVKRQPMILVLDDMQWTDAPSSDLLLHLGRQLTDGRLLIIAAYRPDEIEGERGGERHPLKSTIYHLKRYIDCLEIGLDYTTEHESTAFVDAYLAGYPNALGPDFRQALLAHTRGNPLFMHELIVNLLERKDLQLDSDRRLVARPSLTWSEIPDRIEDVIKDRVERLEHKLQDMLSVASVEGTVLSLRLLRAPWIYPSGTC